MSYLPTDAFTFRQNFKRHIFCLVVLFFHIWWPIMQFVRKFVILFYIELSYIFLYRVIYWWHHFWNPHDGTHCCFLLFLFIVIYFFFNCMPWPALPTAGVRGRPPLWPLRIVQHLCSWSGRSQWLLPGQIGWVLRVVIVWQGRPPSAGATANIYFVLPFKWRWMEAKLALKESMLLMPDGASSVLIFGLGLVHFPTLSFIHPEVQKCWFGCWMQDGVVCWGRVWDAVNNTAWHSIIQAASEAISVSLEGRVACERSRPFWPQPNLC